MTIKLDPKSELVLRADEIREAAKTCKTPEGEPVDENWKRLGDEARRIADELAPEAPEARKAAE